MTHLQWLFIAVSTISFAAGGFVGSVNWTYWRVSARLWQQKAHQLERDLVVMQGKLDSANQLATQRTFVQRDMDDGKWP